MRSIILALAVGCAVSAVALPISNPDPLADVSITGLLVPVNTTTNTTEPQVPANLTSPLPDVGEEPLSGAAFLASPPASSDPPTSDPSTSDDPPARNPPTNKSTTGIPPASSSLASSSPEGSPSMIDPAESSSRPFKLPLSLSPEAAAFSSTGFKRKVRAAASSRRAGQERAAFLASPPASRDLAASEPPTSNDPPANGSPAGDPPASSGLRLPSNSDDPAALSITAFKRIFRAVASSRRAQ